ncbi:FabG Dehydrogenases with different specificities (related to short-chain alcohol dehydrogenases) [Candidatus Nanopelagicaceae bacterium]
MELTGYNVVITGGSGGIGSALVSGLIASGASVHNLDIQDALKPDATFHKTDLTSEASVKETLSTIEKIDALIVCAGVQLVGQDSKIGEVALETWQKTVNINMTGAFLSVKHAIPGLIKSGRGSVILIGSPTGMTMEGAGYTAYGASKAGMMGLSRIIAVDYKEQGVRSNVVVPGTMSTPLIQKIWDDPEKGPDLIRRTPLGRMGKPSDLVGLVNWLVSDQSSFATGAFYAVDGGMTAR